MEEAECGVDEDSGEDNEGSAAAVKVGNVWRRSLKLRNPK